MKIKELCVKYGQVGFICNSTKDLREFIRLAQLDGIEFTKGYYKQRNFDDYFKHLRKNEKVVGLVVYAKPDIFYTKDKEIALTFSDDDKEFSFYSRNLKDEYNDWHYYKLLNFNLREYKLLKIKNLTNGN